MLSTKVSTGSGIRRGVTLGMPLQPSFYLSVLRYSSRSIPTRTCSASIILPRQFSVVSASRLKDFFPEKETQFIRRSPEAWPHEPWTEKQLLNVTIGHRVPKTFGDRVAWRLIRFLRYWMDRATGLNTKQQVDKNHPTTAVAAEKPLSEAQWLVRFVFLESIAGGMSDILSL